MSKWIPLTIVALILSCIRVLGIIVSSLSMLLLNSTLVDKLGIAVYYADTVLHLFILLFLAFSLNLVKESIWGTIAYVVYALMSITFIAVGLLHLTDPKVWSALSAVNMLVIIFFTVQLFLIKHISFKSAFRSYSIVLLLIAFFSAGLPYLASILALPLKYIRFTSIIYIIPATIEVYIIYLFYQFFSMPPLDQNKDFKNYL